MKKSITPQRMKIARMMKGLSLQALSDAMEGMVSKQALHKYEQGKIQPSPAVLEHLAEVLGLPISYFYATPFSLCKLEFRLDKKVPQSSFKQISATAQLKMEQYLKLDQLMAQPSSVSNPISHLTIRSCSDVELAARELRAAWQMGNFPIASVYEVLETNGIKIIELEAGARNVLGFSTFANSTIPLVMINLTANETTERKRFTSLHELGHIFLVFAEEVSDELKERYCSRFAGAMLCPEMTMANELGSNRNKLTLNELISIKNRYGISIAALVHRAKDLGIISDQYYQYIFNHYIHQNRKEDGWGGYPIQEHTDRYARLLQRAIVEKYLTWEEATELLGESMELQKEEFIIL